MKLLAALIVIAGSLFAGPAFALDPDEWELAGPDTTDPRSHARFVVKFGRPVTVRELQQAVAKQYLDFQRSKVWDKSEPVWMKLDIAFRRFLARLEAFQASNPAVDESAEIDLFIEQVTTGDYAIPCRDKCFEADAVSFEELAAIPDEQAEDFLHRTHTLGALITDVMLAPMTQTVHAIHVAAERWRVFVENGRSQFPWEALINGKWSRSATIEQPPKSQLIALHPTAAVEFRTTTLRNMRAKEGLAVEVLGYLRYAWKDTANPSKGLRWWGLALAVSLREDVPPGLGGLVHYGQIVTAGLMWHDDDQDGRWFEDAPYIVGSLDLYQLAESSAPIWAREKLKKGRD